MRKITIFLIFAVGWAASGSVLANPIYFETRNLGGDDWEYVYTVDNQTPDPIEEFTIWFDLSIFSNLTITGNPAGWDGLAIQPDNILEADGFADWLAFDAPLIGINEILSGFSVSFTLLGLEAPVSQYFEIVDPFTFDVISDGFTQPLVTTVPEPGTFWLLGSGMLLLVAQRRFAASRRGVSAPLDVG